jgi:hypothetical protein
MNKQSNGINKLCFSINSAISIQIKKQKLTSTEVPDNYFQAIQAAVRSLGSPW